jgi:hypothetical protein
MFFKRITRLPKLASELSSAETLEQQGVILLNECKVRLGEYRDLERDRVAKAARKNKLEPLREVDQILIQKLAISEAVLEEIEAISNLPQAAHQPAVMGYFVEKFLVNEKASHDGTFQITQARNRLVEDVTQAQEELNAIQVAGVTELYIAWRDMLPERHEQLKSILQFRTQIRLLKSMQEGLPAEIQQLEQHGAGTQPDAAVTERLLLLRPMQRALPDQIAELEKKEKALSQKVEKWAPKASSRDVIKQTRREFHCWPCGWRGMDLGS